MYNEFDLVIIKNDIAFEKAYNEFEFISQLNILTESEDGIKSKASGMLKKVIDTLMKLIDSLIEKINSVINKIKGKLSKDTDKIKVSEDPKNIIKDYEDKKNKCYKMIDDVNKCKTEEELEKIKPDVEKTLEETSKKRVSKAKIAGGIIITGAALLTAFALVQNAQKSDKKKISKSSNTNSDNDPVEAKKEGVIARILNSIKTINKNETIDICTDFSELDKNDHTTGTNANNALREAIVHGKFDKKAANEFMDEMEKRYGENAFVPYPVKGNKFIKSKNEWNNEYLHELEILAISGAGSREFYNHMAEVADYVRSLKR